MLRDERKRKKERHYIERVLEVENVIFTQMLFSVNEVMGREVNTFFWHFAKSLEEKRKETYLVTKT